MNTNNITLWGVSVSPYVRKAKLTLKALGLDYKQNEVLPKVLAEATGNDIPAEFAAINYLQKIPALQDSDTTLADSAVICAYLDRKYGNHSVYPEKAEDYAKAIWFEQYGDEILGHTATGKLFVEKFVKPNLLQAEPNAKVVATALEKELPKILAYLDQEIGNKQFLVGNKFSIADIAIGTHFICLEQAEVAIDAIKYPNLTRYLAQLLSSNEFANC